MHIICNFVSYPLCQNSSPGGRLGHAAKAIARSLPVACPEEGALQKKTKFCGAVRNVQKGCFRLKLACSAIRELNLKT